jgi:polygalacturonase
MADERVRDITIQDCAFSDNNGIGMEARQVVGLTVRRCRFERNGQRGGGGGGIQNVRYEDCVFADNNWRSGVWMAMWDSAGFKTFDGASTDSWFLGRSQNIAFRRCTFARNAATGLWFDYSAREISVDQCLFDGNGHAALFVEVTPGPVTVRDSVFGATG